MTVKNFKKARDLVLEYFRSLCQNYWNGKNKHKSFRTSRKSSIKVAHKIRAFKICLQRRPEMDTNGFYGDTFSSGFGDFYTAKRGLPLPRDRQLV